MSETTEPTPPSQASPSPPKRRRRKPQVEAVAVASVGGTGETPTPAQRTAWTVGALLALAREAGVQFHWLAGEQSPAFIKWVQIFHPDAMPTLRAAGWNIEALLNEPRIQ